MAETIFRRTMMDEIERYLDTNDVIVMQGARQVGKTCILTYLQRQLLERGQRVLYIDLEDSRYVAMLDRGVDEFLLYLRGEGFDLPGLTQAGSKLFVLIDEMQYLTNPSSFIKLSADHHPELKLVVSGSSSFAIRTKFRDPLVGRTVHFEIYPLSFREMLVFRGVAFTPGMPLAEKKRLELQALYAEYALYGGYPKIVLTSEVELKERYLQQIVDTYVRKDVRDLMEIRDVSRFNRLLEVLASQSGGLLNVTELANTCSLSRQTIERYLFLLEQTYILRLVRPFHTNLRSELFKTPKVFFFDSGLMQMLWLKRLQKELLGPVFETSVYSELVKLYGPEQVGYWRTVDKKEIDFVVRSPDAPLPIEAKLQFPRAVPAAIKAFHARTASASTPPAATPYSVVGLYGVPASPEMVYPWQLYAHS